MASAWDEQLVANWFRKDHAGRLVFLPFGRKKPGYYIDSPSDAQKTKPFAGMYFLGRTMVQVVGNLTAFAMAEGVAFADPHTPAVHKIKVCLVIYFIAASLFQLLPMWLMWRLYRKSIPKICSDMAVAGIEETSQLDKSTSPLRRRILIMLLCLMIVIAGLVLVFFARR
jgi:hypothetical protein